MEWVLLELKGNYKIFIGLIKREGERIELNEVNLV